MNLTEEILKDGKTRMFMGERGMVKRLPKQYATVSQASGVGIRTLFKLDSKCYYCKGETDLNPTSQKQGNAATIDHKTPISRGGSRGAVDNKVLSCQACNKDKGHLTEGEYLAVLDYRNRSPNN